jgi:hypothetical protein
MYVRTMDPVEVPDGLADLPPGPALGALLAGLDLARVPNEHVVSVMQAQHRQVAHEQARLLESIVEVGRSTPFSDPDDLHVRALFGVQRLQAVQEWTSGEIAAALTLTGRAAETELHFAATVVTALPLVHAALAAGSIDRPKAWVFADHLDDLTAEQIRVICTALVPLAPGLTSGQLRARLIEMIHDIDPEHAPRRYSRAVRERAVVGYLRPDGTVTVTADGLPADEAAVACERMDLLAEAVQRAGHPGRLGQIQADLFLGMLDGAFHHMTETQIIAVMVGRLRPEDAEPGNNKPDDDEGAEPSGAEPSGAEPSGAEPSGAEPSGAEPSGAEPAGARSGRAGAGEHGVGVGVGEQRAPSGRCDASTSGGAAGAAAAATCGSRPHLVGVPGRRAGVEIRVGLLTLIGCEDRSGEVAGLGPVLPDVARALVAAQHRGAEWRFAVTDADGHLVLAGVTRQRPAVEGFRPGWCRGGVVEVHVGAEELARLTSDPQRCGAWSGPVSDIARQYDGRDDARPRLDGRPGARFARAALARHVEVRDRTCAFPGCRRPARRADKDHTRDHAWGGSTTHDNIGPLCDRHHRYKTEGGWALVQPEPGRFRWTSPLGRVYRTRGEPISPPTPPPCPRPAESDPDPGTSRWVEGPTLPRLPHRTAPPRRPSPDGPDDPPF